VQILFHPERTVPGHTTLVAVTAHGISRDPGVFRRAIRGMAAYPPQLLLTRPGCWGLAFDVGSVEVGLGPRGGSSNAQPRPWSETRTINGAEVVQR
jgi:hypothetical protein